jgi:pimeloyl-ACP methyl ester carboxylesterase
MECGHMSAIERPDEVNAVVVPFVRDHIARG